MNSKITKQDVKLGRIFRCSICDAKCDDTWQMVDAIMVCGRMVHDDNTLTTQCSQNCHYKRMRDDVKESYEKVLQGHEKNLPEQLECLKKALEEEEDWSSLYFKAVKFSKMHIKLLTRFLSRQMTLAEIQAEFYTVSRSAMDIAEEWMEIDPDDTETYMNWVNTSADAAVHVDGERTSKAWSVDYC